MKKTCVIGWPIAHSRSPLIHNYWMKQHGIPSLYEKLPVEPPSVADFVRALPASDYLGCNVTIPHKENAAQQAAVVDDKVRKLGAANTLYVRDGKVHATNTDGEGFMASLRHDHPTYTFLGKRVVLLGAGGASRAIIDSLLGEGVAEIHIINRSIGRVVPLRETFGPKVMAVQPEHQQSLLESADLLVNTTSLGMEHEPPLTLDVNLLPATCLVADIVYTPLKTDLLVRAEQRGLAIVKGLGMLLHQAVRGFELWYGIRPAVTDDLTALVEADVLRASAT